MGGRDKDKLLNPQRSVFDIALINERTIPEVLSLIKLDKNNIKEIKDLIDNRNDNLAHAKGGIESDPNKRMDQYLDALKELQPFFVLRNDRIAEQWLSEISEEDDLSEYVDAHLSDSQLCSADFRSGMLAVFSLDGDIPFEEWQSAVSKTLTSGSQPAILWLKYIVQKHIDKDSRLNMIRILNEVGKLDEDFKAGLLQDEKDPETIELLRNLGSFTAGR